MPSISGPRSTVASKFTVTPWVSGAICSSLIVLSSLYFQSLTAPVACFVLVLSAETSNHRHRKEERDADFLLVFAAACSLDPTATRLETKCTSGDCELLGRRMRQV